ncbi:MAG: DUF6599 family protein [Candidatus Acidiferrales bacterium]
MASNSYMRIIDRFRIVAMLCLGLATAFALPAAAAAPTAQTSAGLPDSFSGWTGGPQTPLEPSTVAGAASTGILTEYGYVAGWQRAYTKDGRSVEVRLYQMKDPSDGYGLYSFLRGPEMHGTNITEHSSISPTRALMLQGNFVVDATGKDFQALAPDWKGLVAAIAPHADSGAYPILWQHLPESGIEPKSDHYLLGPQGLRQFFPLADGDWLGFSDGAEAEVARYRVNGNELTLLVVDFPTPQIATSKLEQFSQRFNLNAAIPGDARPTVYARRELTLVGLVAGARSQEEADTLLSQVHSAIHVTWNEPGSSFTEPGIGPIIVGIIVGTGVICLFAVIAGVAFGGVRLLVKRLLPGKVFDRDSQLQVLQLGLGSKPIQVQDFYGVAKPDPAKPPAE